MNAQQFKQYGEAAQAGTIADDQNPIFILSGTSTELLSKIAKGEIDVKELAKRVLEGSGLDIDGKWVGFGHPIK